MLCPFWTAAKFCLPSFFPPHPPSTYPFPPCPRFDAGSPDLDAVVFADYDPATHKKRLAKLAARIQREAPEEWEKIRKVEKLIERLESPQLR